MLEKCEYCNQDAKYQFKNGKWCCSKRSSGCPEIKRRTAKTVEQNIDKIGLEAYRQSAQIAIENRRNEVDENGLNSFQRAGQKAKKTAIENINEDGLNSYEQGRKESVEKMKNDVDKFGFNAHQRKAKKMVDTNKRIGEDGLNNNQRSAIKMTETRKNDIDIFGLNSFERAALKGIETKRNDVDKNGVNGLQRAASNAVMTNLKNLNEDGLNGYQQAALKGIETKRNDVDKNGVNALIRAAAKTRESRINDIDENGLNSYQRCFRKRIKKYVETLEEWPLYQRKVRIQTEIQFREHYWKINPDNKKRGNKWHLDHIYSVFSGFENNIPSEIIAHWTNLQLLPGKGQNSNPRKGKQCGKTREKLYENYFNTSQNDSV